MTGDPPVGTEDVFPKDDPDETPEAQQARLRSDAPMRIPAETQPGAQDRADAIVRRESGVTDFSDAASEDRSGEYQIEDYPGQDDPLGDAGMEMNESPGATAARGINDFIQSAERVVDGDSDTDPGTRPRR